ncbi:hypothetical protein HPB51_017375 [Rhipicephalus microplus]|uniref:Uncharacterized protein n=1 Tax=Rhipicephalus microplus TaxID=6941 RepID=A0A9J6DVL0_RHIMP|nr:hypothetical protein HPB51_017375 [Rhipicephalus microplus]
MFRFRFRNEGIVVRKSREKKSRGLKQALWFLGPCKTTLIFTRACSSLFCIAASGSSSAGHSSQRHSLGCFQCSWLAEQVVDAERQKDLTKRWKEAYERSEDAIDNPFKEPLLGVETFSEMPTKSQLFAHCSNCTKPDGMCARWTFYGNTGSYSIPATDLHYFDSCCRPEDIAEGFRERDGSRPWPVEVLKARVRNPTANHERLVRLPPSARHALFEVPCSSAIQDLGFLSPWGRLVGFSLELVGLPR